MKKIPLLLALLLAGCSSDSTDVSTSLAAGTPGLTLNGRGPAGAQVTLWEATTGSPRNLASTVADSAGSFTISAPGASTSSIFYLTADLGAGRQFVSVAGASLPSSLTINELTTVAAGYSMAQFWRDGQISGEAFPLRIAALMNDNLVDPQSGASSPVLLKSPNGDESNSLRSTRSLANVLAAGNPDALYALTTPPGGARPATYAQALANLCRFPQQNVGAIYSLSKNATAYSPDLTAAPDAWTICVKLNDTGDDSRLFAGVGNLVFDKNGYVWIANNVTQGSTLSCNYAVVLQPNGKPSVASASTPPSILTGGGILGPGFGVDIDQTGQIWFGNFGWGGLNPGPTSTGSASVFSPLGAPISGPQGIQAGTDRVQDVNTDGQNNVWLASFGNDRVMVFPNADPSRAIFFQEPSKSAPFDIAFGPDGTTWVTNSGGLDPQGQGSVARYRLNGNSVEQLSFLELGHSNKGLSVDSQGNAWVASGGDNKVYVFNASGAQIGTIEGGTGGLNGPWSTTVDGDDNIWVANFSSMRPGNDYTNAAVTKLAGANPATRPPGLNMGDPISPPSGYTLPSAGAQVLLHNGTPLYGPGGPPSFSPLQRQTSLVIDRAGNVWATNNWKPNIDVDLTTNPGGDGLVVFVGAARPPRQHR